jgi:hypothetical protein
MKRWRVVVWIVVVVGSLCWLATPSQVNAVAPFGACCLPQGVCSDLFQFSCEDQGGTFIGFDATCATVTCNVTAAPLLSGAALLAGVALVAAAGVFALRRRAA